MFFFSNWLDSIALHVLTIIEKKLLTVVLNGKVRGVFVNLPSLVASIEPGVVQVPLHVSSKKINTLS